MPETLEPFRPLYCLRMTVCVCTISYFHSVTGSCPMCPSSTVLALAPWHLSREILFLQFRSKATVPVSVFSPKPSLLTSFCPGLQESSCSTQFACRPSHRPSGALLPLREHCVSHSSCFNSFPIWLNFADSPGYPSLLSLSLFDLECVFHRTEHSHSIYYLAYLPFFQMTTL